MNPDIRICFIGDSFVNGTGDEDALGWAGRLCKSANNSLQPAITYYDLGIRRNTSSDILARLEAELTPRLPEECDSRVVISCGVNDTTMENGQTRVTFEDSIQNVKNILILSADRHKTLMVGPPPVDDAAHNTRTIKLCSAFNKLCNELNVPYIETINHLVEDIDYRQEIKDNDGAHPTSKGYEKLARIIGSSTLWWF